MTRTGFKVFHFGCAPEYRGHWMTAATEPGFHIWQSLEAADRYQERLQGGEIRMVKYRDGAVHFEPDGPAVTAKSMFVL